MLSRRIWRARSMARPFIRPIQTTSRVRGAAQLAEVEEYEPYYPPIESYASSSRSHHPIQLPPPLPTDVPADTSLYPTTGVIDSISMISICLRRPEHIPRAYQIFKQLFEDSKSGIKRAPDAELWGRVIQGVASLGKDEGKGNASRNWRDRAARMIDWWEDAWRGERGVVAGRDQGGLKVYQGWFAGMVSSATPLDALGPYLLNEPNLASRLLSGIMPSDMPVAYEALLDLAHRQNLPEVADSVRDHQGIEREKREMLAREVIEEVQPVLEGHGRNLFQRTEPLPAATPARFAITNLRKSLARLNSPSLPRTRQIDLEIASYAAAEAELQHAATRLEEAGIESSTLQRNMLQSMMYKWLGQLTQRLREDMDRMRHRLEAGETKEYVAGSSSSQNHGMEEEPLLLYLSLLPVEKLALITILEIMRMSGSGGIVDGMKALRGMLSVGKAVETEYRAETIKGVAGAESPYWQRVLDPQSQKPNRALVGQVWSRLGKNTEAGRPLDGEKQMEDDLRAVWTPAWSQMVQLGVGSYLVNALLSVAKVEREGIDPMTGQKAHETQPAFSHGYEYVRGKKLGVIKLNPVVANRLAKDDVSVVIHPKHLPMLVEPAPWTSFNEGGYLRHRVPIMRFKESREQQIYLEEASLQGELEAVFHGLDVLSSTPWMINRKVFDIVLAAWNSGEAVADIPPSDDKAQYALPLQPVARGADPEKRAIYVEQVKQALTAQRKDHSERCKFNYNLEIARSYLNDTFYLPHNMDFRGRAYPIPPHLSPVGDDLCRGLLTFGVKKPLGETGLKWLQIHLANVFGFDKASFEERARFAQDHEEDIFDSADRPLDGNRWWLKAEDPWQCLATCFDLAAALRSPDPTAFESSLPVHQDGTCNGMQHYAALGGDVLGARAVNLENGDRPADIYSGVADAVNKVIKVDQEAGNPLALLVTSPIGRKIVKQTVMTTVYGVTFVGARDQIAKQLIARGDFPSEQIFTLSAYIAKVVLSCIGDLFSDAKGIMEWLTTSARLISRSIPPNRVQEAAKKLKTVASVSGRAKKPISSTRIPKELMTSVTWTTPLGLPVVQPYRKAAKRQVMTALQTVYIADPNAPAEVSPQKQATAFPPNFIHSLDATHMLLTALGCKQSGITFSSVHDSYWTHAASVEPMSEIIRDKFIHLHKQDIIGDLRDEFLSKFGENRIPVKNAKQISSVSKKKAGKAVQRRATTASSLVPSGPSASTSQIALDTETTPGTSTDELELATGQAASDDVVLDLDVDIAAQSELEIEDRADSESDPSERSASIGSIGLSSVELEVLESEVERPVRTEKVGTQSFVLLKDVLPPTPSRGQFDVNRIRESAYFFS